MFAVEARPAGAFPRPMCFRLSRISGRRLLGLGLLLGVAAVPAWPQAGAAAAVPDPAIQGCRTTRFPGPAPPVLVVSARCCRDDLANSGFFRSSKYRPANIKHKPQVTIVAPRVIHLIGFGSSHGNSTIADNSADGGAGLHIEGGTAQLQNTILARNFCAIMGEPCERPGRK